MRSTAFAIAVAIVAAGCGGDPSATDRAAALREEQVRDLAADAGVPGPAADLLASAAGVVDETFRVTYDLGAPQGGRARLVQDPPRRRVDLDVTQDGRPVTRTVIADGDLSFACDRRDGRWSCRRSSSASADLAPFGQAELDRALSSLRTSRGRYEYRVNHRDLAGVRAACLVTTPTAPTAPAAPASTAPGEPAPGEPAPAPGTLCVSGEGVPLLVETATAALRAVEYGTDVDSSDFDLPADPA